MVYLIVIISSPFLSIYGLGGHIYLNNMCIKFYDNDNIRENNDDRR